MAVLTRDQIAKIGFKQFGENVQISEWAHFYGASHISIGNNVRIDDFCILSVSDSGNIIIGNNIHIGCYSSVIGREDVVIKDFANISSKVTIYSSSDDWSGEYMTSPMVPKQYTNLKTAKVVIGKHVIIGTGSTILPGVIIGDGGAVGAMSLVNADVKESVIVYGIPAKKTAKRSTRLFELEKEYLNSIKKP